MKKNVFIMFLSFFLLAVLFLSSVSALTPRDVGEQIAEFYVGFFEPILAALFGGWDLGGLYLFEKFLIFVMLVGIIFVVMKKAEVFKDNRAVIWIISIVIPLIAVRFFNIEQLNTIIFSYKWLAIGLTTLLPLIIFFFFIYSIGGDHPFLRKILWIILFGIYLGIYSSAIDSIDKNIYVWTIIAIILFFIFDKKINYYFIKSAGKNADESIKADMAIEAWSKYQQATEVYQASGGKNKIAERQMKRYHDFLKKHGLI